LDEVDMKKWGRNCEFVVFVFLGGELVGVLEMEKKVWCDP
jgi:hypothetical protein